MKSSRYVVIGLALVIAFLAASRAEVNRNTARQLWYMLFPAKAPKGGLIFISGRVLHSGYDYGDTWFSRCERLKQSLGITHGSLPT